MKIDQTAHAYLPDLTRTRTQPKPDVGSDVKPVNPAGPGSWGESENEAEDRPQAGFGPRQMSFGGLVRQATSAVAGAAGQLGEQAFFVQADRMLKTGRPEQAIKILETLLDKDPQNLDARIKLGTALNLAGQPDQAREQLQLILTQDPDNYKALHNLALMELDDGRPAEGLALLDQSVAALEASGDQGVSLPYENRASYYLNHDQSELALADLGRAIAQSPDNPELYRSRIEVAESLGRHEQAAADYGELARLAPDDAEPLYQQARILDQELGRSDEAAAAYAAALERSPGHYKAEHNLGILAAQQGHHDEAIGHFSRAIEQMDASGDEPAALPYVNRAKAYIEAGRYNEAVADLKRAHELGSDDVQGHLEDLLALQPEHAGANQLLGRLYLDQGDHAQASASYHQALASDPGHEAALNDLGVIAGNAGDHAEAASWFTRSIEGLDTPRPGPYANRAQAHLALGDYAAAAEDLTRAIDLGGPPELYNQRGRAYAEQGLSDLARADYDRARELGVY